MAKNISISADLQAQSNVEVSEFRISDFERTFGIEFPHHIKENLTFDKLIAWRIILDASSGNQKSIQEYLDRRYGKPKQTNVNENHNMDYMEFLKMLKEESPPPAITIEADTSPSPDLFEGLDG